MIQEKMVVPIRTIFSLLGASIPSDLERLDLVWVSEVPINLDTFPDVWGESWLFFAVHFLLCLGSSWTLLGNLPLPDITLHPLTWMLQGDSEKLQFADIHQARAAKLCKLPLFLLERPEIKFSEDCSSFAAGGEGTEVAQPSTIRPHQQPCRVPECQTHNRK